MKVHGLSLVGILCAIGLGASSAQALIYNQTFALSGTNEVPPVNTPGLGASNVTINLDTATNNMSYTVVWGLLSSSVKAVTFNGPAAPGVTGPVILTLSNLSPINGNNLAGNLSGTTTVSNSVENLVLAGNTYINITTANHPGGEIRGNLPAQPPTPIPEPAALGMLGLGVGGLIWRLRRR